MSYEGTSHSKSTTLTTRLRTTTASLIAYSQIMLSWCYPQYHHYVQCLLSWQWKLIETEFADHRHVYINIIFYDNLHTYLWLFYIKQLPPIANALKENGYEDIAELCLRFVNFQKGQHSLHNSNTCIKIVNNTGSCQIIKLVDMFTGNKWNFRKRFVLNVYQI